MEQDVASLREKVARAIWIAGANASTSKWEQATADAKIIVFQKADAAIAAMLEDMREPTEAMIDVGGERFGDAFKDMPLDYKDDRDAAMLIWQAMLTAYQEKHHGGR